MQYCICLQVLEQPRRPQSLWTRMQLMFSPRHNSRLQNTDLRRAPAMAMPDLLLLLQK